MESETKTKVVDKQQASTLNNELPGQMVQQSSSTEDPLRESMEPIIDFFKKVPPGIIQWFSDNKQPILYFVLILSSAIAVYLTLTVLDAINRIPLFAPLFELIGIGYSAWFVIRYLRFSSTRAELIAEFEALKTEIIGKASQNS